MKYESARKGIKPATAGGRVEEKRRGKGRSSRRPEPRAQMNGKGPESPGTGNCPRQKMTPCIECRGQICWTEAPVAMTASSVKGRSNKKSRAESRVLAGFNSMLFILEYLHVQDLKERCKDSKRRTPAPFKKLIHSFLTSLTPACHTGASLLSYCLFLGSDTFLITRRAVTGIHLFSAT